MKSSAPILLVEDDANDVFFVSRALAGVIDAPLEVVSDGQAAIDYIARGTKPEPCVALLDLNLPRKSGLEVLKWVRQQSKLPTLIVIVLTSSTAEADIEQAYRLGANSYVIKPTDATKLKEFAELVKRYWLVWNEPPPSCVTD